MLLSIRAFTNPPEDINVTRTLALAAASLLVLAACKDGGVEAFNPGTTGQKVEQAFGAVDNNQAVQSMEVMSGALTFTGAPPAFVGTPLSRSHLAGLDPTIFGTLQMLERSTTLFTPASPAALFPSAVLGKTFVYSTQTGKYQASDLTGAPANGVRFLLYAVNPVQHTVVTPLQQIGTLDLTDKSSQAGNTMGVKAVINNVTVLEYDATASITGTSFSSSVKGYVTDGTNRLDFDLSLSASGTTGLRADYKLTGREVSLEILATATSSSMASVTLTVTEGKNKLEVSVSGSEASSTGTVKYNGTTVANISVTGDQDPVFTGANGKTLTSEDLAGLKKLFDQVDTILNGFDDVLVPYHFVFSV
ncbi:MAG: hypothetical protein HY700_01470 [Gemmatimonadetes bacterium]|nr:hypothetical protein [Gemmatimonadota bacterium]